LPQQEEESKGGCSSTACGRSRADDEPLEAPASKRPKQHGHGKNYSISIREHERALPTEAIHSTPGRMTSPAHNTPTVGASASKSRGISQRAAANYDRFTSATPTANTAAAVTRGEANSIIGRRDALGSGVATDNQRQEDGRQEEEEETETTFS
ncbi:unnamed protein product, partial [Ectocarpus sp. 12 AP-2014]